MQRAETQTSIFVYFQASNHHFCSAWRHSSWLNRLSNSIPPSRKLPRLTSRVHIHFSFPGKPQSKDVSFLVSSWRFPLQSFSWPYNWTELCVKECALLDSTKINQPPFCPSAIQLLLRKVQALHLGAIDRHFAIKRLLNRSERTKEQADRNEHLKYWWQNVHKIYVEFYPWATLEG